MKRRSFLLELGVLTSAAVLRFPGRASGMVRDENELLCRKKFELAESLGLREKPFGDIIVAVARSFLGTKYVAHTLEIPGEERLVVNMKGLDCVTLYENALVFARCIKKGVTTFDQYKKELQHIRYRGGVIDGYPSRLHYTSDYFHDNELKGIWTNITRELGGVPFRKKIDFMSTHPESYRQLKENPELIPVIRRQEEEIMERDLYYIPEGRISAIEHRLQNGDILGLTTDIEGLDTSHTGIVLREEENVRMIHAPQPGTKVEISERRLSEYVTRNMRQTGIMVVRPIDPVSN